MPVCLFVRPSVRPSACLSVCLSVRPSVQICLSVCPRYTQCLSHLFADGNCVRLSNVFMCKCGLYMSYVCLSVCLSQGRLCLFSFLMCTLELRPILPAVTPLALLALWLAFLAVTLRAPPTNGKALRSRAASVGRRAAREVS